ncbi:MAG TPA: LysE family transporter, partial [Rhodanobacteraceae bacterium]|nr:LysE family transporter [Rhodanobacteraceae bacterium]
MGDEMEGLLGLAGLLWAGVATPGPNNLVVWHVAARRGFSGALPAIVGVVLGGLALLAAAMAGLDALLGAVPWLRSALLVAGCVYLAWL